jgi:plastocyanin
MCDVGREK